MKVVSYSETHSWYTKRGQLKKEVQVSSSNTTLLRTTYPQMTNDALLYERFLHILAHILQLYFNKNVNALIINKGILYKSILNSVTISLNTLLENGGITYDQGTGQI